MWADQTTELGARYRWVQVFENRGVEMGASSPHPHGQIWAGSALPTDAAREDATQRAYADRARAAGCCWTYADQELDGPRVVEQDADWLVVVPYWAAWPYETLILPRAPAARLADLDADRRDSLAATLSRLLGRYDTLFQRPFPYSMGWHQAPFGDERRRALAAARPHPAAPAASERAQVHGRLRAARRAPAGHHARGCRGPAARGGAWLRESLSGDAGTVSSSSIAALSQISG